MRGNELRNVLLPHLSPNMSDTKRKRAIICCHKWSELVTPLKRPPIPNPLK